MTPRKLVISGEKIIQLKLEDIRNLLNIISIYNLKLPCLFNIGKMQKVILAKHCNFWPNLYWISYVVWYNFNLM